MSDSPSFVSVKYTLRIRGKDFDVWIFQNKSYIEIVLLGIKFSSIILRSNSYFQYLEYRYESVIIRKIAVLGSFMSRLFMLGVYLYTPSLALASVSNLSISASIIIMGLICTVYISLVSVLFDDGKDR